MAKDINSARAIALIYFTSLFLISIVLGAKNHQPIWLELILLLIVGLTLLLNSKRLYLTIGILGLCISFYVFIACLIYNVQNLTDASQGSFFIGYLTSITSFAASWLIFYVGTHFSREQKLISG